MVHGSVDKAGEIKSNKRLMPQTESLGKELLSGCNRLITPGKDAPNGIQ
jgi:hypothetical protein